MLAHNVAILLKSVPGTARDVTIDETRVDLGPELPLVGPLTGAARLTRTQQGVLAQARVHAQVSLECSRCLAPLPLSLEVEWAELYRPSIDLITGQAIRPAEDDALQIDERHVLDLTEMARQSLLLALPLKPVCQPECRGLCLGCGVDLNLAPCECGGDAEGGPFSALARLLDTRP
jgi:uncharacterized protein